TPRRGGVFRFAMQLDPQGFDPHATVSFVTMIPLSFSHSRLVKVKAGPTVKPGTYPIEPDVAESWTQPNDTSYVFKLRKDVRWHPKPPVNGRELTAEDVKFTYDRFVTVAGNPNRQFLESVDHIDVLDRHTVRFVLKEPSAWFLDMPASTATRRRAWPRGAAARSTSLPNTRWSCGGSTSTWRAARSPGCRAWSIPGRG